MKKQPNFLSRLRARPELWTLLTYFVITAVTTGIGLLFRYILLLFRGTYEVSVFGTLTTVKIGDNLAYTVYYASSVVLFYLWKWALSKEKEKRSFVPRFLGYCALNAVSMLAGNWLLTLLLERGVNEDLAFWLTSPLTFLINYLGSRLVVFRDFDNRSADNVKQQKSERADSNGGKE